MNYLEAVKNVVFGHAVADALGVPVEFHSRAMLDVAPLTDMIGYGTHHQPAGTWSDDTSMSIAALDSLTELGLNPDDIMKKFCAWYFDDEYTATGETFDAGNTCVHAIINYSQHHIPAAECGLSSEGSCGNGSLMRIYPFLLYGYLKKMPIRDCIKICDIGSALTHAHERCKVGCGIYAYILSSLIEKRDKKEVATALKQARKHYAYNSQIKHYSRLFEDGFDMTDRSQIKSSGYVVDTLEAAVWCLLNTSSYEDCVLLAANLGEDTDTVAAVAGSLAGALYGYGSIPDAWLSALGRREYLESLCEAFVALLGQ